MTARFKEYQPGSFASTANTPLGRRLWAFITDGMTLHAMKVASDLGQPAVAGIEEALLDQFGKDVLPDRIKQMIGHMVRQAMERKGFIVDQGDVKMNSVPFSKGTRYRRPDWYPVHVFRSSANARDLCFTDTRAGEKLPPSPSGAKWRYWTSFSTTRRGAVAFGISPRDVHAEVQKRGYARRRLERTS